MAFCLATSAVSDAPGSLRRSECLVAFPNVCDKFYAMGYIEPHSVNDYGKVESMKAEMEDNESFCFDPIIVCRDYLIDGVHRQAAAEEAGFEPDTVELEDIFSEEGIEWDDDCEEDYRQGDMVALVERLPGYARDRYGIELHWG